MWTISDLKSRAWNLLRRTYWKSFAVTLAFTLVVWLVDKAFGVINTIMEALLGLTTAATNNMTQYFSDLFLGPFLSRIAALPAYSLIWLATLAVSLVMAFIPAIFVRQPAQIGVNRFFMRARHGDASVESAFYAFQNNYGNAVKISFFRWLFIVLWSMLLVIPGIIKTYEYYMIPYILSENPNIDRRRAFELSRAMTDGEKWNIFCFQLSFIGWFLLSALTCGIGLVFLSPYLEAANAELYAAMRDKVFYMGLATPQDLPGYTDGSGDTAYYENQP